MIPRYDPWCSQPPEKTDDLPKVACPACGKICSIAPSNQIARTSFWRSFDIVVHLEMHETPIGIAGITSVYPEGVPVLLHTIVGSSAYGRSYQKPTFIELAHCSGRISIWRFANIDAEQLIHSDYAEWLLTERM